MIPDLVGKIIEYESGEMSDDRIISFFQELYDDGIWRGLQGHYGRTMVHLIKSGHVNIGVN